MQPLSIFKIAQVKPSNLLPIHWSSSILWNSTRGNVKRTICKFWQQAICKIVVDHPRHFPPKNWPVEHTQKGRTRCLWQWDDKCTFVFPEVFNKKCALCLFSGHLQPWFWLHLCSWFGGYAGGWLEANRETCGLCQSLIGGLQVELRRLINGFYLLHYRLFTQTKRRSFHERCEMTCSGTKCSTCKCSKCYFVRLYRICLPMAKPITLNLCMQVGQTRQTVQSSSLLRKAIWVQIPGLKNPKFIQIQHFWVLNVSWISTLWHFEDVKVEPSGLFASSGKRPASWVSLKMGCMIRVVWSSLVKDYQTNECNLQVV